MPGYARKKKHSIGNALEFDGCTWGIEIQIFFTDLYSIDKPETGSMH
jgi:hypothetical protein